MLMTHGFVPANDPRRSNPRAASIRLETRNASRLYYQRGHDLRTGKLPGYVDPERLDLNRLLIPYPRVCEVRDICKERRSQRETERAMSRTVSIAMTGIITFGSEAAVMFNRLSPAQQDAAFRELVQAAADRLNTSVSGLTVHLDETTIHAHFELVGYTHDGHPLSQRTRPGIFSELQDLTADIMGRHCPGIERGRRYGTRLANGAEFREVLHRTVKQLHHDLPHDLAEAAAEVAAGRKIVQSLKGDAAALKARVAAAGDELAALEPQVSAARSAVDDATARVAEMDGYLAKAQADLDKIGADAARKAKVAKRIKTYAKRLADRNTELQTSQAALAEVISRMEAARASHEADLVTLQTLRANMLRDAKAEALALQEQKAAKVKAVAATEAARAAEAEARAEAARLARESTAAAEQAARKAAAEITQAARAEADRITVAAKEQAETIITTAKAKFTHAFKTLERIAAEAEAGTLRVDNAGAPLGSMPGLFDTAPGPLRQLAVRLGKVVMRISGALRRAQRDEEAAAEARLEAEEARDRYLRGIELQQIFRETAVAHLELLDRQMDAIRDKATGEIRDPVMARFFTGIREGVEGIVDETSCADIEVETSTTLPR